ncbi:MAG TPA: hypothetical protein VGF80_02430 [Galbitalea sp.]
MSTPPRQALISACQPAVQTFTPRDVDGTARAVLARAAACAAAAWAAAAAAAAAWASAAACASCCARTTARNGPLSASNCRSDSAGALAGIGRTDAASANDVEPAWPYATTATDAATSSAPVKAMRRRRGRRAGTTIELDNGSPRNRT